MCEREHGLVSPSKAEFETRTRSALLTGRILLSPFDYAGEYMALETDSNAFELHGRL